VGPLGRTHRRATLHVGDLAVAEGDHLEALLPPAVGAGPSSEADDRILTDLPVLRLYLDAPRAPLLNLEPQDLTGLLWAAS
jgi:hypothetical protein